MVKFSKMKLMLGNEERKETQIKVASRLKTDGEYPVYMMFIVEQETGLETLITFVCLRDKKVVMVYGDSREKSETFEHDVVQIEPVNKNCFLTLDQDRQKVRLLVIDYQGHKFYSSRLIHSESSETIVKLRCDKNRIYVLT